MNYSVRRNILSETKTFSLQENELLIVNSKQQNVRRKIPYKKIRAVTLMYTPEYKTVPDTYQCIIKSDIEKPVTITSNNFVSFGNFKTKHQEYANFIRCLHKKLANNSSIKFKKGLSTTKFKALTFLFVLLILILVIIGFSAIFMQKFYVAIPMLLGSYFFGHNLYKLFFSYKPKNYTSDKIPSEMLPKTIKK